VPDRLKIAKGFALDLDAVTKTFAILAQRRKGKTYTASVIAEEMVAAGQPWVALDPTGAWWGLRASANGKREGLPVLVIGGAHGQLPLERTAGKLMADLVVDEPGWYVFDFSLFESKSAERQFATDFAERFYRRKGQSTGAVHLFVDEADVFVPQRSPAGDQRMLGAFESIVRRGGLRGIGTTLISQRAAVINKNVLEQIDVLVTLRTLGPNDQKAIKAYVDAFGTAEQQAELMGSLASLDLGEAWVWEPGGDVFERVRIRERRTFNSSATPKAGESQTEPVKLADVDLDALRDKIAETVEKAKAEDPEELRKQITALRRELAQRPEAEAPEPVEVTVPVFDEQKFSELRDILLQTERRLDRVFKARDEMVERAREFREELDRAEKLVRGQRSAPTRVTTPTPSTPAAAPSVPAAVGDVKLGRPERAILGVLAQFPDGRTKTQIAILSGYSAKSSSFSNAMGKLRSAGLISPAGADPVTITAEGQAIAGDVDPVPSGPGLYLHWQGKLGKAERSILDVLYQAHPAELSKEEISDQSGYSATSSSFSNALGKLRSLELVDGFKASDALFQEAGI
jgi:hypothetical protein